jgi:hypothetical protein
VPRGYVTGRLLVHRRSIRFRGENAGLA